MATPTPAAPTDSSGCRGLQRPAPYNDGYRSRTRPFLALLLRLADLYTYRGRRSTGDDDGDSRNGPAAQR